MCVINPNIETLPLAITILYSRLPSPLQNFLSTLSSPAPDARSGLFSNSLLCSSTSFCCSGVSFASGPLILALWTFGAGGAPSAVLFNGGPPPVTPFAGLEFALDEVELNGEIAAIRFAEFRDAGHRRGGDDAPTRGRSVERKPFMSRAGGASDVWMMTTNAVLWQNRQL